MTEQAQTAARISKAYAEHKGFNCGPDRRKRDGKFMAHCFACTSWEDDGHEDDCPWLIVGELLALVQQQAEEIAGLRQLEKCCHDPAQEAFNIVLARAEQAERRLAEQTGWRSMESAPKDGTEVLLLSLGIQNTGYMRHVASWRCITHAHISAPHHRCPTDDTCRMAWWAALAWVGGEQVGWMPLPPTPREKEEA